VVRFAARRASGGQMAQPFVRLASAARQSLGGIVGGAVSGSALGLDEAGKEFAFGALHGLGGSQIGL
jgi:hypothetical protein